MVEYIKAFFLWHTELVACAPPKTVLIFHDDVVVVVRNVIYYSTSTIYSAFDLTKAKRRKPRTKMAPQEINNIEPDDQ